MAGRIRERFQDFGEKIRGTVSAVGDAFKGVGEMARCGLRLDFKGVADALGDVATAVTEVTKNMVLMTPAGLAANTLLDGALEKVLDKMQDISVKVVDSVAQSVGNSLESLEHGVGNVAKGLVTADLGKVASGFVEAASGAAGMIPSQIVVGAAATAVGTIVDQVIPGKMGDVLSNVARSAVGAGSIGQTAFAAGTTALMFTGVGDKLQEAIPESLGAGTVGMYAINALTVASVVAAVAEGKKPNGPGSHETPPARPHGHPQSSTTHAPGSSVDGKVPQPKVDLSNARRTDIVELLRQQNWTDKDMRDFKKDIFDYTNHGDNNKREEIKAKWGDRVSADLSDTDVYPQLAKALAGVR